ncbi:MAG: DUF5682 family protein [Bacteroidia bacterium]|nr:DUF5682 family protein [Bacteroidia bacterium]
MVEYVGIRHHGPGSAYRTLKTLQKVQPDFVLIEAPEELNGEPLAWISQLIPPVGMLFYEEDTSKNVVYPFAEFSPEWQAMQWACQNNKKILCIDMSISMQWHYYETQLQHKEHNFEDILLLQDKDLQEIELYHIHNLLESQKDDLSAWMYYAGASSFDEFLDHHSESHTEDVSNLFEQAVTYMRSDTQTFDAFREAIMRMHIRNIKKQHPDAKIVVVCGAWHLPELKKVEDVQNDKNLEKQDKTLIQSLGKTKFNAKSQWIPWTNDRLTLHSGYGAGVQSPVLYQILWNNIQKNQIQKTAVDFFCHAAHILREKQVDIPPASVLEAAYFAQNLCQFRNRATPSLQDIQDAMESIWFMGDSHPIKQYQKEIFIGENVGKVPKEYPVSALEQDFRKQFNKLFGRQFKNLDTLSEPIEIVLDLREDLAQKKHIFLSQVSFLELPFATLEHDTYNSTYKRNWILQWNLDSQIAIKEKSYLGSSLEKACHYLFSQKVKQCLDMRQLCDLLNWAIEMNFTKSTYAPLLAQIDMLCTQPIDIEDLLSLITNDDLILKYTNADTFKLYQPTKNIDKTLKLTVERATARLPLKCMQLAPEAAQAIDKIILKTTQNLSLLKDKKPDWQPYFEEWKQALWYVLHQHNTAPFLQGSLLRQFIDWEEFNEFNPNIPHSFLTEFQKALSQANEVHFVGQWLQGLLQDAPGRLLYIPQLWTTLSAWIDTLSEEHFKILLPIFRKAVRNYSSMERNEIKSMALACTNEKTQQSTQQSTDVSQNNSSSGMFDIIDFWTK